MNNEPKYFMKGTKSIKNKEINDDYSLSFFSLFDRLIDDTRCGGQSNLTYGKPGSQSEAFDDLWIVCAIKLEMAKYRVQH